MLSYSRDLRRVYIKGTTTVLGSTDGDSLFLSIPGMPNQAVLKRIRIMTADITLANTEKIHIRAISDPARYRAAEAATAGSGEEYVIFALGDDISETTPNVYWLEDTVFSDDIVYTDNLKSGCFHIMLEAASALSAPATFTVEVWAEGLPTYMDSQDSQHFLGANNLQILRWSTGNIWTDLTTDLFNPLEKDWETTLFLADSDIIFFGSPDPINGLYFNITTPNTVAASMPHMYWNGSTWDNIPIQYDNCTDANTSMVSTTMPLHHTGVFTWEPQNTWVPAVAEWRKVSLGDVSLGSPPIDHAGSESFVVDSAWEPKYWMYIFTDNVPTAKFKWIRRAPFV